MEEQNNIMVKVYQEKDNEEKKQLRLQMVQESDNSVLIQAVDENGHCIHAGSICSFMPNGTLQIYPRVNGSLPIQRDYEDRIIVVRECD